MSTGHVLTKDERLFWQNKIRFILSLLYKNSNRPTLELLLLNLYEFCVACCATNEQQPIKLNLLKCVLEDDGWVRFCTDLYKVRGYIVHSPYSDKLQKTVLNVVSSKYFETLIVKFLPDYYDDFLDLILGYSRYV